MGHVPYLVGIAGGSGSGKTTVVRQLREMLPPGAISVISQDDYYRPIEEQALDPQGVVNFDLPTSVDMDLLTADLLTLAAGDTVRRQEYTFNQPGMQPQWVEVRPAPILLVEGLFVFHHEPLRNLLDLKVFVDTSEEVQLQRRLARDAADRGYGPAEVLYQWEHHVMPAYRSYLLPYRDQCEVRLVNESCFRKGCSDLAEQLTQRLRVAEPAGVQMM